MVLARRRRQTNGHRGTDKRISVDASLFVFHTASILKHVVFVIPAKAGVLIVGVFRQSRKSGIRTSDVLDISTEAGRFLDVCRHPRKSGGPDPGCVDFANPVWISARVGMTCEKSRDPRVGVV